MWRNVLNRHEILTLAFHEDHLPPMLPLESDEVWLELEETIAQGIKHEKSWFQTNC